MASLISVPNGLAAGCVLAALFIGGLFGILTMCILSLGRGGNNDGP